MALLDFLKRKKEVEKAKKPEKVLIKKEKPEIKKESLPKIQNLKKKTSGFSYDVIKSPHISEKATNLADKNQYVFEVNSKSNKTEIKRAIEGIYGVDVLSVNMIKIPAKRRRLGRTEGYKKGYTKAIVKIAQGQKIEIL